MSDEHPVPLPSLEVVLEDAILADRETWPRKGKFYPSDLGTALGPDKAGCPAELWGKMHDKPQTEPSAGVLLMFKMGDLVHDYIAQLLKKALPDHGWEVIEIEERVRYDEIGGRLDVRVRHTATGQERVIDLKTKRGAAFRYLPEPKETDEVQVRFYEKAADAAGGDLLYIDREGQNFVRHFPVERDDEQVDQCIALLRKLRDMDEEDLPLVGFTINIRENKKSANAIYVDLPWQMKWCNLRDCYCMNQVKKAPPSKIVARLHDDGTITPEKPEYSEWLPLIKDKLSSMFPEQEFYTDE